MLNQKSRFLVKCEWSMLVFIYAFQNSQYSKCSFFDRMTFPEHQRTEDRAVLARNVVNGGCRYI